MYLSSLSCRALVFCAILLAAFAWFGLTLPHLTVPGLYYDEVIFVNAGLGGPLDSFAQNRVFGWPMFIMPYIGALKSLLHAPLFALFGVNIWTIRLPSLIFSFGTVLLLAGIVRQLAGQGAWYLALLLFTLDPALLWTTRTDFGPTTLAGFFRALALFTFFGWLGRGGRWRLPLLVAALVLGLWDKLNFVWFLGGLVVAAILVYPKRIFLRFQQAGLAGYLASILGLGVGAYLVVARIWPLFREQQDWLGPAPGWERLRWLGLLFSRTFDGQDIAGFHFPLQDLPQGNALWFLGLLFGVFILLVAFARERKNMSCPDQEGPLPGASVFFLLLFFFVSVQIFLTRQVGGLHHLMMVHPLPQLFGFALWAEMGRTRPWIVPRLGRVLLAVAMLGWLVVSCRLDLCYVHLLGHRELENPKWSSAIYELSREIEARPFDMVFCTDWGLHAPLFALAAAEHRTLYRDLWPTFKELGQHGGQGQWLAREVRGKRLVVVLHGQGFEEQRPSRRNTLRWIDSLPGSREHWVVRHGDGRPLYEVYRITP